MNDAIAPDSGANSLCPDNVFPRMVYSGYELTHLPGSLTKRELFAAMAMQGLLASRADQSVMAFEDMAVAATAVQMADSLITALNMEFQANG